MENQEKALIKSIRKGLLQWYDFRGGSRILFVGDPKDALLEMLTEQPRQAACISMEQTCDAQWRQQHSASFDYIVSIGTLEWHPYPEQVLSGWRNLLRPDGQLLLGMNNRLGIRYFCGDRDIYTQRNFDGIENYRNVYAKKEDVFRGRSYSGAELREILNRSGWSNYRFYSVFSDLENPALIYAEDYLPKEDLSCRAFPCYYYPKTVFLEEEALYGSLASNGIFHQMANAYLIECSLNGRFSDVLHVTSSLDRGRADAMLTIIRKSGVAEKRAAYPEGRERLTRLIKNGQALRERGIPVIDAKIEGDVYVMPYCDAEVGQVYLKRLMREDTKKFLQELDYFSQLILKSSELVSADQGDGQGAVLRRGYLDMIPLNSFHIGEDFVFYDQEFCEENYPANVILERMVSTIYDGNPELGRIIPINTLYERYGLLQNLDLWKKMEWSFLAKLRKEKELKLYHAARCRDNETVFSNRQRLNYSIEDNQRLFVDIFRNADTRKLILFGSGAYAKRFLSLYGQDYPPYAIVDNSWDKWGQTLEGVPIQSPELLRQLQRDEYKVLICVKRYLSVMNQLDELGAADYSIFDPGNAYPRKKRPAVQTLVAEQGEAHPKKYHIGYIAGVFDLFHIGHLNMFKRAKEQCDYLIVGVVTDEGVIEQKKNVPFIPFDERIELVRSCRYVDEAVKIPAQYCGTRDAFRMYHFDCQFSGSDYIDNPDWLAEKVFLEDHGSEMVFFPYTESTSSSKIKTLIQQRLL